MTYQEFLAAKVPQAKRQGFEPQTPPHPSLKGHQRDIALWCARGGRRACFAAFGLGKTRIHLQVARWATEAEPGKKHLIIAPLGVRQEFTRVEGPAMGMEIPYVKTDAEITATSAPVVITNYERVRDGGINVTPDWCAGVGLDEASVLRSFGSLTYQSFLKMFKAIKYRYVFTATPSPNRHKELIHYGGFLGVMDTGEALTRFFQRDSEKAGNLTLYPHMEDQFWLWLSSWAVFMQMPSDLGYDDTGYDLPGLNVEWHCLDVDHKQAWGQYDSWGQSALFLDRSSGLKELAKTKQDTMLTRVNFAKSLIDAEPSKHWLLWHDLEAERHLIEKLIPEAKTVYGSQDLEDREEIIMGFGRGDFRILATKPIIAGSGCNLQRHCSDAIFLGSTYKFNDFIQSVHRILRFQQPNKVNIHVIYSESETPVIEALKAKWAQHNELVAKMTALLKRFKLSLTETMDLTRTLGCERAETCGNRFRMIRNDCVIEIGGNDRPPTEADMLVKTAQARRDKVSLKQIDECAEHIKPWPDNCADMVLTSIPFGNQYEYSPSFNDFGHNPNNEAFFAQMEYLAPHLLRVLRPGRVAAIHVKDRIRFGNVTGLGMPTVDRFSDKTADLFEKHGFAFFGRITIDTDVVRENNQTYRLGWTENSKDGTKMGVGMPEYVILLRKLPSDLSTAYADVPVKKDKNAYTRAQWQIDAAGLWRSNGNRLPDPDLLLNMPHDAVLRMWRDHCRKNGYDYQEHVKIGLKLEDKGYLPASFMLFPPVSLNPDVWTDIARMRVLNSEQERRNEEKHVCVANGSLVLTRRGYIPIESIEIGDHVLTHLGRWRPVIAKRCIGIKKVIQLEAQGVPYLKTTPDHKCWSRSPRGPQQGDSHPRLKAIKNTPSWIPATETLGGYVNLKLPPIEDSHYSEKEWWIIGRWLGDGHFDTRGRIHISCGHNELTELKVALGDRCGAVTMRRTTYQIAINDRDEAKYPSTGQRSLRAFLIKCGKVAHGKRLPAEALALNKEKSEALLSGYLSADGHHVQRYQRDTASSVSRALVLGMAIVAQRAREVVASVYAGREAGECTIEGRTMKSLPDWVLSIPPRNISAFTLNDGAWKKVRKLTQIGEEEVWDIQVQEDESFTAEGCIVHNCPLQLDIVERLINRYTNPNEVVLDPFAGIGTVPYLAVKMDRIGWGIELCHEYWRCASGYCEQAEAERNVPTLFDMQQLGMKAIA